MGYIDTKMSNTGNAASEGKQAVGVPNYTLRASVENVANKDYWASAYGGYLVIGNPRTFKVSMTVDY